MTRTTCSPRPSPPPRRTTSTLSGATPVFIGGIARRGCDQATAGPTLGALLLGAALEDGRRCGRTRSGTGTGLSHGRSPGCSVPGTGAPAASERWGANEYGDYFDIMGSGADRFGAFQLRVLGPAGAARCGPREQPVPSRSSRRPARPARRRCASVAPAATGSSSRGRSPTGTSSWRTASGHDRFDVMQALPVGGVIVSRARASIHDRTTPATTRIRTGSRPPSGVPCGDTPTIPPSFDCGGPAEVFMPGTALASPAPSGSGVSAAATGTSPSRRSLDQAHRHDQERQST